MPECTSLITGIKGLAVDGQVWAGLWREETSVCVMCGCQVTTDP